MTDAEQYNKDWDLVMRDLRAREVKASPREQFITSVLNDKRVKKYLKMFSEQELRGLLNQRADRLFPEIRSN